MRAALTLRAAAWPVPDPAHPAPAVDLVLVDTHGVRAAVDLADHSDALTPLPGTSAPLARTLLRQVTVPLTAFGGVDLTSIAAVEVVGATSAGSVLVADLAFTTPAVGAPVGLDLPSVTVQGGTVEEGSGAGTALIGLHLDPAPTAAVEVAVELRGVGIAGPRPALVRRTIAPGTTCLAVAVPIQGDTSPSAARLTGERVTVVGTGGVIPGTTATDELVVREDDGVIRFVGGVWVPADSARSPGPQADPCAPRASSVFLDVPAGLPFEDEIGWLAASGVSTGWTVAAGQEFRPLAPIARDAMAAFLYRHAGSPDFTMPTTSPFADVSPTQQHYRAMAWLATTGISTGWATPRGQEFRPFEPINRDAMAAFLYRYAGSPSFTPTGPSPFLDVPAGMPFEREMRWLAAEGISAGWTVPGGSEYRPLVPINRDAMATFLHRYSGRPATPR
ncbi:hypothetical protein C8046_13125 [Serinibacter arcticus]|uniref:SLH domain-containing protein n=2 Tax=Serinibacter arcticus TaxID=1655435 RepID=A0A2U1ZZZ1_9MICO|nr:hypothetical protein C8046_13125 [Serinibacter arcticus]